MTDPQIETTQLDLDEVRIPAPRSGLAWEYYVAEECDGWWGCIDAMVD